MTETKPTMKALTERVAALEAENELRKQEINRLLAFAGKQTDTLQQLTSLVVGRK